MKKFVIATMIAACIALCAAVWPHGNAVEETPVPAAGTAVSARKATVVEITEKNSASLTEMENEISQQEASQEERPEPETESIETPADSELQPSAEQTPAKNSEPEPTMPQPSKELRPGDKVYVAGFGWVEYEGPNHCEDGTDIYENGNKIGVDGLKCAENIQNRVKSLLTIKLSMLFYNDLTSMLNGWHGREGEYIWRMNSSTSPKQSAIVRIARTS